MRKKTFYIIVLLLAIITIPILTKSYSDAAFFNQSYNVEHGFPDLPKSENWEYIKNRVFDGETPVFKRLEGPILFQLMDATKADSSLVKDVILDIRKILPHKEIHFFNDFMGMSFSAMIQKGYKNNDTIKNFSFRDITESRIYLHFEPSNLYKNGNYQFIQLGQGYSIQTPEDKRLGDRIVSQPYVTVAMGDIFSHDQKKEYLKAALLRKLVFLQNDSDVKGRSVFRNREITGLDCYVLDRDIFLLTKLYSSDFLDQFKNYMYKAYPWVYVHNFLNKVKTKVLAIWTCIVLVVFFLYIGFNLLYPKRYKYSYLHYFLPLLFITISLLSISTVYRYLITPFVHYNLVETQVIVLPFVIIIALLLMVFDKIFIRKGIHFTLEIITKTCFTFLVFTAPIIVPLFDSDQDNWLKLNLLFMLAAILALGRGLLIYLNHFSESLVKQKDIELSHLREVNAQSELKLLQSHINPHFLYNSLNSIAGLAHDDADKTEKMALSLSDLFRYSINKKGEKMSTVNEEVTLVENYLEIEKIRFGERLVFTLTVDDAVKEERIPMFMLQPILENAIKHGASKIGGEAKISLDIKKDSEHLLIAVSDNGPDFPKGLVSGHGLQTVYDLLRLSYGNNASLRWENSPKKQIVISIKNNQHE